MNTNILHWLQNAIDTNAFVESSTDTRYEFEPSPGREVSARVETGRIKIKNKPPDIVITLILQHIKSA